MVNRTYGNRYQVTEKIGMGGMAEVFKATDSTLGRTVAVKVMLPQYAADANFAARFRQEAQSAANLSSPYIVNIYDWGKDQDSYYIVMEYVRGTDLKTAVSQRGRIHPRKVAEIGSQVCSALSVAHGYDIIHRDIKSANIMVQADGNVKVMDFGIAQAGRPGMTTDSSVLGTAHYVSPEQAQGKELKATSDLYSLGVVMYEAATGQLPFDGPDVVSVAMKQVSEAPVPPREINPDIDPRLEAIILRAMEKNPAKRFQTANEMMRALDDYLSGRGAAAPTQVIGAGTQAAGAAYGSSQTTVMPTAAPASRNNAPAGAQNGKVPQKKGGKGKVIAAIVIVLILAAVGIGVAMTQGTFSSKVIVPNVVGMTQEEAASELQKYNLQLGTVELKSSETVESGKVMNQDPAANDAIEANARVNLVVSSGMDDSKVSVPNLTGLSASEAERALEAVGLKGEAKQGSSDSYDVGLVYEQSPAAFNQVASGSTVTYTVAANQKNESVSVPSVIGTDGGDAQATLSDLGLTVKTKQGKSDEVGEGEVCEQSIASGTKVDSGTTITITISTGSTAQTVPNIVGSSESSAKATIKNEGFKVTTKYATGEEGKVISQSPSGNSKAKAGSTVTITVGTGVDTSSSSTSSKSSSGSSSNTGSDSGDSSSTNG